MASFFDRNHRVDWFTIGVLCSLDGKWRGIGNDLSFESIYSGDTLHCAWGKFKEKHMSEYREFLKEFAVIAKGRYTLLDDIIQFACTHRYCVRMDGNGKYHLDQIDQGTLEQMLRQHNIPAKLISDAAKNLNNILEKLSPTSV